MKRQLWAALLLVLPLYVSAAPAGILRLDARPTMMAEGSPGIAVVQEIEDVISKALRAGVAVAKGR